jgi:hypothetical protein
MAAPNLTGSSSSSRSVTSCRGSSAPLLWRHRGLSGAFPNQFPMGEEGGPSVPFVREPALSADDEAKPEHGGRIKMESEPTPPPPPSSELWCTKYAVPPIYRNTDDGEWAGY